MCLQTIKWKWLLTILLRKYILMAHFGYRNVYNLILLKGCDEESRRNAFNTEKCYLLRGTWRYLQQAIPSEPAFRTGWNPSRQCPWCCVNAKELLDFVSGRQLSLQVEWYRGLLFVSMSRKDIGAFFLPRKTNQIDRKGESLCGCPPKSSGNLLSMHHPAGGVPC